jgi:hypothetical protein
MTPLEFCEKYKIKNYTINNDNTIDVNDNVNLNDILGDMTKLPVKFGKVSGYFDNDNIIDVNDNVNLNDILGDMTKLPVKFGKVSGYFSCSGNKLTTLEGCPTYIGGNFYCYGRNKSIHHILGNVQGKIYCYINTRIVI